MWRAMFLAFGTYVMLLGAECLILDKAVLAPNQGNPGREIRPADWTPWSLLAAGAVTILYSFSLPRRVATK
jgi:hypothetical protein